MNETSWALWFVALILIIWFIRRGISLFGFLLSVAALVFVCGYLYNKFGFPFSV